MALEIDSVGSFFNACFQAQGDKRILKNDLII